MFSLVISIVSLKKKRKVISYIGIAELKIYEKMQTFFYLSSILGAL